MQFDSKGRSIIGDHGCLQIAENDEVTRKLCMLIEGECEGLGPTHAGHKYGYSRQRYSHLRAAYVVGGSSALVNKPSGPRHNYRRTDEVVRQVIRHRVLDPLATPDVIAQKLRQTQFPISTRSVERVIAEYGLQKKDSTLVAHSFKSTERRRASKRK